VASLLCKLGQSSAGLTTWQMPQASGGLRK